MTMSGTPISRRTIVLYRAALFAALAGAVATSGWINVEASDGTTPGIVLGLLAPAGYMVCAGIGELIPRQRWLDPGFLATVAAAGLTMSISWWHGFELALAHNQPALIAGAIALVPETTVLGVLGGQRRLGLLRSPAAGPARPAARPRTTDAPQAKRERPPAPALTNSDPQPPAAPTIETPATRTLRVVGGTSTTPWSGPKLHEAIAGHHGNGWSASAEVTKKGVSDVLGISRNTVRKYWDEAAEVDRAQAG